MEAVHTSTGKAVTAEILPGTHVFNGSAVYTMAPVEDMEWFKFHGNATTMGEMKAFQSIKVNGKSELFLDPASRQGQLMKTFESTFMPAGKELLPYSEDIPLYKMSEKVAKDFIEEYNNSIIAKLPRTDLGLRCLRRHAPRR